ncbi:MAG: protease HtpX [Thioalkalispiraceae bacterium]|jgi:heat shock protein HtpX
MNFLFSLLKSISLFLLTVLAMVLVNEQFMMITGLVEISPDSILFLEPWQFYLFLVAMGGALSWTMLSKWFVCKFMRVRQVISPADQYYQQTYNLLGELASRKNICQPQLAIYESADINAFTTGLSQKHAIIVVSSGLLYSLNHDEQKAVLAHEITHIANHDMLALSLMQGVINVMVLLPSHFAGWLIDNKLLKRKNNFGPAYYTSWLILQFSIGFIATMLVMWFSRWREFNADKGAAELVGSNSMQAALCCLQAGRQHHELPGELGSFGISGGIGRGMKRLFASHPPLSERIMALKDEWH